MTTLTIEAPSKNNSSSESSQVIKKAVQEIVAHCTIKYKTYSEFFRSALNVRKKNDEKDDAGIQELAALLRSQGLLQNLVGYDEEETGETGIVAGGRRLKAIGFNIENGYWPDDMKFPYMLVTKDEAVAVSLAENSGRKDMHHADIVVAMLEMFRQGVGVDDIALAFGVEPLRVRQRLKLANMSPVLFDLYHNDKLEFTQMVAYAITDDHKKQESALQCLGPNASAWKIKELLAVQSVSVTDKVARFVGLDNYKKAGGNVVVDLFDESDKGSLDDKILLEKLAIEKLEKKAAAEAMKGHAWVECRVKFNHYDKAEFIQPRNVQRELTDVEKNEIASLEDKILEIELKIEEANEKDGSIDEQLKKDLQEAYAKKRDINRSTTIVHPGDEKLCGVIVTIGDDGKTLYERNIIRPDDKKKMDKINKPNQSEKPKHSDRLTNILTSHRTIALQAELVNRPDVALVVATHAMVCSVFRDYRGYGNELSGIGMRMPNLAEEVNDSAAYKVVTEKKKELAELLPQGRDTNELFTWMMEQNQEVILSLLAYCTALSCDVTLQRETTKSATFITAAQALQLDMTKWWKPTPKNYFNHVSKANMMAIVKEVVSVEKVVPMEKMKKDEAAQAATLAIADVNWLPEMMRAA